MAALLKAVQEFAESAAQEPAGTGTAEFRADHPRAVPDQPGIFTRLSAGGSRVPADLRPRYSAESRTEFAEDSSLEGTGFEL